MSLSFRPAAAADYDFLYALHRAAMREYVAETYGAWDEDWQGAYFREHFDPALQQLILWDGQPVGVWQVQERAEELFVALIEILPAFQGRGIGTRVLRGLINQADEQGKMVALRVLKSNPRARRLYEQLGFHLTGEKETHYIMAWEGEASGKA